MDTKKGYLLLWLGGGRASDKVIPNLRWYCRVVLRWTARGHVDCWASLETSQYTEKRRIIKVSIKRKLNVEINKDIFHALEMSQNKWKKRWKFKWINYTLTKSRLSQKRKEFFYFFSDKRLLNLEKRQNYAALEAFGACSEL